MSVFHDEVEIEDFEYDEETETYYFPCPCGDKFAISKEDLENGEDVATCPSCSLIVKVIYDQFHRETLTSQTFLRSAVEEGLDMGD
ncbi:diphthamide biosynthesis protein 3 [Perca flavescens]|uniref:diphthamide biosynthesis protein 3 n=1 Tax=Perca flavescens TaxID=8167 RepID=UPI00106DE7AC|nr:DPH3 homolog [Perca flavescens]